MPDLGGDQWSCGYLESSAIRCLPSFVASLGTAALAPTIGPHHRERHGGRSLEQRWAHMHGVATTCNRESERQRERERDICLYIYACIYIYAVESRLGPRWVKTWSKVGSKLGPKCFFACFSLLGSLKITDIVCRGAKIGFGSLSGCKKGFLKEKLHFMFLSFLCWTMKKRKDQKKLEKEHFKRSPEKWHFWVVVNKKDVFTKMAFLEK